MSKLVRALVLGAMLAAMNLAGLTAVASAQSSDEPTGNQDARRPPTQAQVGEAWRQPQVAPEEPTVAGDPRRPPTESQVGESWRHPTSTPVSAAEPSGLSGWPCWPPDEPAAGLGLDTRPDHGHLAGHPRWGCRAHPAAPSPCRRRVPADRTRAPSWATPGGDMVGCGQYSPAHAADAGGATGDPGRSVGADHLRQRRDGLYGGPGGHRPGKRPSDRGRPAARGAARGEPAPAGPLDQPPPVRP